MSKYISIIIGVIVGICSATYILQNDELEFEKDFFMKKYDTNDIKIITLAQEDSAYSPHEDLDKLYKTTHNALDSMNIDSLYSVFLKLRRETMSPTYNNCVKKSYVLSIKKEAPIIDNLYYVQHRGKTCVHDYNMILRTFADIDMNFFYFYNFKEQVPNSLKEPIDTCMH